MNLYATDDATSTSSFLLSCVFLHLQLLHRAQRWIGRAATPGALSVRFKQIQASGTVV
jgi:hypothetical protein